MPLAGIAEANEWKLYVHPAFGLKLDELIAAAEKCKQQAPHAFAAHPKAKLLKRVLDLMLIEIPRDPNSAEFQLGNSLGPEFRYWRRARFLGRFRLFFRFSSKHKVVVYGWVNDEATLRKAGARTDPHMIFRKRLEQGNPPDSWDDLLHQAKPVGKR